MNATYQFDAHQIEWAAIDDPSQPYPCKYWLSILGADPETGRLDMIVKWPPNSYCHFHRHVADTAILVLEGEQHVIEIHEDGSEGEHKVRPAGTYASSRGGVHTSPLPGRPIAWLFQPLCAWISSHSCQHLVLRLIPGWNRIRVS